MLRDYTPTEFDDPLGPWLTTGPNAFEPGDIPPGRGLLAQNVEYKPGQVRTRYGFSPVSSLTALGDSILAMEGWLSPVGSPPTPKEILAYLASSGSAHPGFNIIIPSDGFSINLYNPAGAYASAVFAAGGLRLYMTPIDINGYGTDVPNVFSLSPPGHSGGPTPLFSPPFQIINSSFAYAGTSAGLGVTPGLHYFGFLFQTLNGYTGAPGPINGSGTFTPLAYTVVGTGGALEISITAAWPSYVAGIYIIMTTVDNPSQFYIVPTDLFIVPGGLTSVANIRIDIDDGTLAATAIDATPYFNLFNGVIKPSHIAEYSNRMVYVAPDPIGVPTIFISDLNNYEAISLSRSVVYLPGQRQGVCTFNLYGNLYIVGPHWTFQTIDNGGDPVTWAAPQLIDGQIGTLSPNGITVNSAQGIAWICDVDGLYLFAGGSYQSRPISYYQKSDWIRINWAAAATVRVVDSKDNQRVHVLVPLDGAPTPTHVMSWDYTRGLTPETVNYSLDSFGSFAPGAIAIIQDDADKHIEIWLGPHIAAQPVLRQNDGVNEPNPYRDNNAAISSLYQTGLMPRLTENVLHHIGDHLRITGAGTCNVSATTLDGGRTVPLTAIILGPSPAQAILRRYHLLSEATTLTFSTNALDTNFVLSAIVHYAKEFVVFR